MSEVILEIRGLTKVFGGLVALDKVDLSTEAGKISAIIGPNGAGKTTLFNLITGVYPASEGEIYFRGKPLRNAPAHKRAELGIVRTFQQVHLFGNMTVLENVMTGQHPRSRQPDAPGHHLLRRGHHHLIPLRRASLVSSVRPPWPRGPSARMLLCEARATRGTGRGGPRLIPPGPGSPPQTRRPPRPGQLFLPFRAGVAYNDNEGAGARGAGGGWVG